MRILQYKKGSKSAKELADALGTKRVVRDSPTFTNRYNHTIINWGCSTLPNFPVANWVNHPDAVKRASNKLSCFRALQEVIPDNIPEFTTSAREVHDNLDTNYRTQWLARTKLTGHSGDGIIEIMGGQEYGPEGDMFPEAPLYVKYIKKAKEYRAHVINGRVVDVQEKRKRRSVENSMVDYRVRSSATGWVYCRDDVDYGDALVDLAVDSVRALGLDFGAVDIIYNAHYNKYYVLEVNTACGMEGATIELYANELRRMV